MKVCIVGKEVEDENKIRESLIKMSVELSDENPDLIIAYGGDGILLIAERRFPGVPKVLVKGSEVSNKGHKLSVEEIVKKYFNNEYSIKEINKIKAIKKSRFENREVIGINDIVIRNNLPTEAIRFSIQVDGEPENLIGDGIVVATAYGSDAYFYSITKKTFKEGIGVAFNNITIKKDALFLGEDKKIKIKISRGPGVLVADNNRDYINLERGDEIEIFVVEEKAKIVEIK
jgi:NAD+ kinase